MKIQLFNSASKINKLVLFGTVALLVSGFFVANSASAATLEVGAGKAYTTIQSAITASVSNDTISVAEGTYPETLNLGGKTLSIEGAGVGITTIDASALTGYAIQSFGNSSTVKGLTLKGTTNSYGFKISGVNNITLENIKVENSKNTGIDLNGVIGATLNNIETTGTISGFGINMVDSKNITLTNITTSGNAWGGVSIQTEGFYYPGGADNIVFSGSFNASESVPLLVEQDACRANGGAGGCVQGNYAEITNITAPNTFGYKVYGFRTGDNYKQTFYQTTLDIAKSFAKSLVTSTHPSFSSVIAYNTTSDNYYVEEGMKIQDAISASKNGDTINVGVGTYAEVGQIIINKNLTIVGANKTTTIIKPSQNTTNIAHADSGAWILVNTDKTFNLSNVTLDGAGKLVAVGILSHGHGTIDNNVFTNIAYNPSGPDYMGMAIELYGSDMTISNNSFSNIGRIGVYNGFGTNSVISGNSYTGKGIGNWLDYAFEVGRNGHITVSNNTITNNLGGATDGSTSAGILATSYYASSTPSSAVISGNSISSSTNGIAVGYDEFDATSVTIHNNKFAMSGTQKAISSTHPVVDASNNWFGSANVATIATLVDGNVNYIPWYIDSSLTNLQTPITHSDVVASTTLPVALTQTGTANGVAVTVDIPKDIVITGNIAWTGAISTPTPTTATVSISGFDTPVSSAITVGSSDSDLTFTKGVRILFAGQKDKYVGWYNHAGTFNEITATCTADDQATGDALPENGDCKINSGNDLAVWTKHFTTFATFSKTATPAPTPAPVVSSGGGGGGGNYIPTSNKTISSFTISGQLGATAINENARTITITMPVGTDLTALTPEIVISGVAVTPNRVATNFSTPKTYTVTAANGETQTYVVTVTTGTTPSVATTQSSNASIGQVLGVSTFRFTTTLHKGSKGDDVTELQTRLAKEGIYSGPITGYFGALTETAVKVFQKKYGIEQVGLVGPKTIAQLNSSSSDVASAGTTGQVLGASTSADAEKTAELKAQLVSLMAQLVKLLQAQASGTTTQ